MNEKPQNTLYKIQHIKVKKFSLSDHCYSKMQTRSNIRTPCVHCCFCLFSKIVWSDQLLAQPVYIENEFRSAFDVISAKVCNDQRKQQRLHHVAVNFCVYSSPKAFRATRWFVPLCGFSIVVVFTMWRSNQTKSCFRLTNHKHSNSAMSDHTRYAIFTLTFLIFPKKVQKC